MNTKTSQPIDETIEERPNDIEEVLQQIAPYWRPIAGGLALILGVVVVFSLMSSGRDAAKEQSWSNFIAASANRDPEMLQEIADSSSGEVAGWAQYTAAQAKLIEGTKNLYEDRDSARSAFNEAVTGFNKALERTSGQPLFQKQALWGLAQAHEGLNDLGSAKEKYQQIVDKWPDSSIAERAQKNIARLDAPGEKQFYDWFYAQTPPAKKLQPNGQIQMPSMELPSSPDFKVPDPNLLPPDDSTPSGDASPETSAPDSALPTTSDDSSAEEATATDGPGE